MEEISVKGEMYVKATLLAKKFGYTADYLGQLCRSGQVKATLIGRSWYVNEDSLVGHKKGRYRSSAAKSKESLQHMVKQATNKSPQFLPGQKFLGRYSIDEDELLPVLAKKDIVRAEHSEISADNNTPLNKVISDDFAAQPIIIQKPLIRPKPAFRTIPALKTAAARSDLVERPSVQSPIKVAPRKKKSASGVALIVVAILLLESALLVGAMGLEKRLSVSPNNAASLILYDFDRSQIQESITNVFSRYF